MIPNEYQDAKCRIRIPGQAAQVLAVIERFTFGWKKNDAIISFRTFRKMTGLDDSHIARSRNKLLNMGIITTTFKGNKRLVRYRIVKDYTKYKPLPLKDTTYKGNKSLPIKASKP